MAWPFQSQLSICLWTTALKLAFWRRVTFCLSCRGSSHNLCLQLHRQVCWVQIDACVPWCDSSGMVPAARVSISRTGLLLSRALRVSASNFCTSYFYSSGTESNWRKENRAFAEDFMNSVVFTHWQSTGDMANTRYLCTVPQLCCWGFLLEKLVLLLLLLVLLLPLSLLISAGKMCLLSKYFLPGFFELETYSLSKATLAPWLQSSFLWCVFLQGSRCDFFQLISLCSNLPPVKASLLIIIVISYFWPGRCSPC